MKTNSFTSMLKSDFYRLRKLKSIWIALAVMFGLLLMSFMVYWLMLNIVQPGDGSDILTARQQLVLSDGRDLLYGSSSTISLGLFMAIITCIFVGNDFSGGFIAVTTARGTSRATTYFSKWLTLVLLSIVYIAFGLLLSGIFYSFNTYGTVFSGNDFGYLMRNLALQILSAISIVSIFVMIAFLARSTGSSIAICLASYILINIVAGIISVVLKISYGENYQSSWIYFLPFNQMDAASLTTKLSATEIIAATIMPIVYTAISTIIGYFTFEGRDIK